MIDTERSLEHIARLHTEIMRERAEGVHEAAQAAKARLVEREEALARLRIQIAMLKSSLKPKAAAPAPIPAAPIPVLEKEASLDSARFTAASLPATVKRPELAPVRVVPSASWKRFAPYAAIAACAVMIEAGGFRRPPSDAPDLSALAHPAPAVVLNAKPAAKGAPVVVDDDRSQEALVLVHEWKLPGDEKSLAERLGGEFELPGGRPSWSVERTGARGYRVTFQGDEKEVPYSFEADLEARVVWPTPETQELLAPRFTAAFRDAVR